MTKRRRRAQSGNTITELALIMAPMMALFLAIIDLSLPIFKKSTFEAAVREGCRYGITYQTTFNGTTYTSQTAAIKAVVQANTMGFLAGTSGAAMINVKYYDPVTFADVTASGTANRDGNIIEVSIQGYTHSWMAQLPWSWGRTNMQLANAGLTINASSADRLETLPGGTARPTP